MKNNDEFYIGWMPKAPYGFARFMRLAVIILLLLVVSAAIIIAVQQRKFSTAVFEFGQLTEIKGVFSKYPVPSVRVTTKQDAFGNTTYLTIPLVGYGKSGAEGLIAELEKENKTTLDKKQVSLKGTLLYSDGKTLLQIDGHDKPLVSIDDTASSVFIDQVKELGTMELTGEILDPKCYFGVMKPGQGKPHRDCAIRCIEGGISPVFRVSDALGATGYYLILDENGRKMNNELKDYVAEPVSLRARVVRYNDWTILYTFKGSIKRTGNFSWLKSKDAIISCGPK